MKPQLLNLLIPAALAYGVIVPELHAQTPRSVRKTIIVSNGDTIINGKRLAEMDKKERERFQKEFTDKEKNIIEEEIDALIRNGKQGEIVIRKFGKNGIENLRFFKFDDDSTKLHADSITWNFRCRLPGGDLAVLEGEDVMRSVPSFKDKMMLNRIDRLSEILNSQSFHFRSTDKEGIVTETDIRVNDVDKDVVKRITGKEQFGAILAADDFTLFPSFSSGKINVSFSLASKGSTSVTVYNADHKVVFADRVNNFSGTYLKPIPMGINGRYYIAVQQGGKCFLKEVLKR